MNCINTKIFKTAFTLAEVLITIGVIGIVAALTVPFIKNYYFEKEAVSKVKETYSTLNAAIRAWQADESCLDNVKECPDLYPTAWPGGAYPHNSKTITQKIAKYLKVANAVYTPSDAAAKNITWLPSTSYQLNGTQGTYSALFPNITNTVVCDSGFVNYLQLNNGVIVKIGGIWWQYNIYFDINGKKLPNRVGKDQFVFSLSTAKRKAPNPFYASSYGSGYGICSENATTTCTVDGATNSWSPTAYVLNYGKLPDLKKMGYPTSP